MSRCLVLGSDATAHAIVQGLQSSCSVSKVYAYPGNGGMNGAVVVPDLKGATVTDIEAVVRFAKDEKIDLAIVGTAQAMAAGAADRFRAEGVSVVGPTADAARIGTSDEYARQFFTRHRIPFLVPDKDSDSRLAQEVSYFAMVNKVKMCELGSSVSFKRAYDLDKGPDTAGMGAYAPARAVALDQRWPRALSGLMRKILFGLAADGIEYNGMLCFRAVVTPSGPQVTAVSVDLADLGLQVILPRLRDGVFNLFFFTSLDCASMYPVIWTSATGAAVVLSTPVEGEQPDSSKARRISGLPDSRVLEGSGVSIFHGATQRKGEHLYALDGSILTLVGQGPSYAIARQRAYQYADHIKYRDKRLRGDIAASLVA